MKKILLTGADGMLGNHICRELLSRGYGVRVLLQPGRNNHSLEDLELDAIYADITDESSVGAAMEGMDALIHVAASTQIWPGRAEMIWKVNFDAVKILAAEALGRGLKRIVHIGTANSFGPGTKSDPGTEDNPYTDGRYRLDYQDSKRAAQEYLLALHRSEGLPVRIINPTFMFGAYDSKPGAGEMLLALHRGSAPGAAPGGKNYVAARAVAVAAVNALNMGRDGECYICGGENLSYREAFDRFAPIVGAKAPKLEFPRVLVGITGLLGSAAAALSGKPPTISYAMARISNAGCYYSSEKARRELNLPDIPIDEAADECFAWLEKQGYVDAGK
jgi:dihydroflavonol-4-reductase